MGSLLKGVGKIAKKVAKPEILLPLALMAASGGTFGPAIQAKMLGTAATGALPASTAAAQAAGLPIARSIGAAAAQGTPGWLGMGGSFSPFKGTLAKGIMAGLKNPLSMKGAATYGGLGLLAKNLTKDKVKGKDDKMNKQTQASYDMMRKMGEGMYSDEDINTYSAPYLAQMGGDYDKVTGGSGGGPDEGGYYEKLYPGLNYNLTRFVRPGQGWLTQPQKDPWNPYMAEGGRVGYGKGKLVASGIGSLVKAIKEMMAGAKLAKVTGGTGKTKIGDIEKLVKGMKFNRDDALRLNPRAGARYGLFGRQQPKVMDDDAGDLLELIEKFGGHEGGRVGLAGGGGPEWGSYKDWLESSDLLEKYPELEDMTSDEQQNFLESIGLLRAKGGRIGMQLGGLGSIPQAPMVPQGQQLDGRGGGFIPMGAQEGKDDVPAMLANNEFVMTSDAVRAAGGGDINKGAQKMYDLMNNLEARA